MFRKKKKKTNFDILSKLKEQTRKVYECTIVVMAIILVR